MTKGALFFKMNRVKVVLADAVLGSDAVILRSILDNVVVALP